MKLYTQKRECLFRLHYTETGCGGGESKAAALPTHAAPCRRLHTVSLRVGDAPATAGDLATSRSVWKLRMRICHSPSEPGCWKAAGSATSACHRRVDFSLTPKSATLRPKSTTLSSPTLRLRGQAAQQLAIGP